MVRSPLTAARATFALKAGEWFRRGRLLMVSPVHGDYRRYQAEIPLIALSKFPRPALKTRSILRGARAVGYCATGIAHCPTHTRYMAVFAVPNDAISWAVDLNTATVDSALPGVMTQNGGFVNAVPK